MKSLIAYILVPTIAWLGGCNKIAAPVSRDQRTDVTQGLGSAKVTVNAIQQNGKSVGQFSRDSFYTQVLEASANSAISGSSVSIPPGSLAIDTEVSLSAAPVIGNSSTLEALGLDTTVNAAGAAVAIESSIPTDTLTPFTLAIPLPDSTGLALDDPYANLSVIYFVKKVSQGAASFTGIFPRSQVDISTGYANVSTTFFGTYQAIITRTPIEKPVEKPIEPIVEEKPPKVPSTPQVGFFVAGLLTTSFEPNFSGQRHEGLQGMLTWLSPFYVGSESRLTASYQTYISQDD